MSTLTDGPDHTQPGKVPSNVPARIVLWTIVLALVAFVAWARYAAIDQITRGTGQIIASSRTQVIQAVDGGVLAELKVHEGDVVERGQVLARLDPARTEASYLESDAKGKSLRASIARLRAEVLGGALVFPPDLRAYPDIVQAQTQLYQRRQSALKEEVAAIGQSLEFARQELAMNEKLLANGDIAQSDVLKLRRQVAELEASQVNRRNKYLQDAQQELAHAEDELAGTRQQMAARRSVVDSLLIRAPLGGVVKNVRVTTQGGVLRAGDELMQIVPNEDTLIVEAKIRPADIAFIAAGMPANVKIDAYDYTVYGTLDGEVTYISPDTLVEESRSATPGEQSYYRVHVKTRGRTFRNRPNQKFDLIAGMTATVEIKTGKNTVLRYLLKPLLKTLDESLGER